MDNKVLYNISDNNTVQCLICREVLKTLKSTTTERYYKKHLHFKYTGLMSEKRQSFVNKFENDIVQEKKTMKKILGGAKNILKRLLKFHIFGKSIKPYFDGESIKKF